MSGIRIIPFKQRHFKRILEIENNAFAGETYSRELFQQLWEDCGDWFFIAKQAGRIAGYIVACRTGQSAEIVSIAVEGPYRRRGVGKALMEHLLGAMRKAGVSTATLMVRTSNTQAIRLYRSLGFRRLATVARYYQDGGAAYRMGRTL